MNVPFEALGSFFAGLGIIPSLFVAGLEAKNMADSLNSILFPPTVGIFLLCLGKLVQIVKDSFKTF